MLGAGVWGGRCRVLGAGVWGGRCRV
ncbi:MAG: hypothetical protein QOD96_5049, partial [Pseudonocardiales bacterium]|nr:hypothetical protein [Pseudonocardiales bacterium]